jgi:hypothetical protein
VTSTWRGWVGLEAAHFRTTPAFEFLERDSDLALVDIAASAGFSDQSKLSTYFKRAVGVTLSQFPKSARNRQNSASLDKNAPGAPPTISP